MKMHHAHKKSLSKIQSELSHFETLTIKKKGSNTLRNRPGLSTALDSLKQILELNADEQWIWVEPKITFEALCRYTLRLGFVPLVVPEFKTITVGGAVMGAALESSSHLHGQFNDTCLAYELILTSGEKIVASRESHADLFYAIAASYGTLALLTAVKIKLKKSKPWVNLEFSDYSDTQSLTSHLLQKNASDFLEGVILDKERGVAISGCMEKGPLYQKFSQSLPFSPWYIQKLAQKKERALSMPLFDYLFRLDRSAFWMGRYVHSPKVLLQLLFHWGIPEVKPGSLNPSFLFRLFFGWMLSSKKLYEQWHRVPSTISEHLFFIHDFYTPAQRAQEGLSRFIEMCGIFPIWLCPIKGAEGPQILSPHYGCPQFLNIGLYGIPNTLHSIPKLTKQCEELIISLGGRKMLYSFCYFSEEEFNQIYPSETYKTLRKKYGAEGKLPSLFEKVCASLVSC